MTLATVVATLIELADTRVPTPPDFAPPEIAPPTPKAAAIVANSSSRKGSGKSWVQGNKTYTELPNGDWQVDGPGATWTQSSWGSSTNQWARRGPY